MATQRLTPARFVALYELAVSAYKGHVGDVDKRTLAALVHGGLIEQDGTTEHGHPTYRATASGRSAARDHLDYLANREDAGRLFRSDNEQRYQSGAAYFRSLMDEAEARAAADAAAVEIGDRVNVPVSDEDDAATETGVVRDVFMSGDEVLVVVHMDKGYEWFVGLDRLVQAVQAEADTVQATEFAAERGLVLGQRVAGDLRGTPVRGRITRFYMSGDVGLGRDFRIAMAVVQDEATGRNKYMDVVPLAAAPAPLPKRPAGRSAIADAGARVRKPLPGTTLRRDMTWTREVPNGRGGTLTVKANVRLVPFAEDGSADRFTVYYSRPASFDWNTYRTAERALRSVERFAAEYDGKPEWTRSE